MPNTAARFLAAAGLLLTLSDAAQAAGLDAVQGAWTMVGSCEDAFKKTGSKITFRHPGSSATNGVIISGNRIQGANMTCTAARVRKVNKTDYTVMMNCATSLMFDTVTTGFRVIDADRFERFNPGFPEMTFPYTRCKL